MRPTFRPNSLVPHGDDLKSLKKDPPQLVEKRNFEKDEIPRAYRHSMFEIIRQESFESNGYDSTDSLERYR